ncbi:MAG: AAA family ATPase [Gemmatimonadota bacterium]
MAGGFLAGADLHLSDGLNCFIGGRGTGKTTALEFLRFALGLLPDQKIHPQRRRALESLVDGNLASGRLTIDVNTKAGISYSAERGKGDSITVRSALGEIVPISLDRDEIFSADVFSQNEIEEIASNAEAQLQLLDRFDESANRRLARELEELGRALEASAAQLLHLDDEIYGLRARAAEVAGIEERLRGLTQPDGPDGERLTRAHTAKARRIREERIAEVGLVAVQRATRDITALETTFRDTANAAFDDDLLVGENAALVAAFQRNIEMFAEALRGAADTAATAAAQLERTIDEQRQLLTNQHVAQEAEYAAILAESQEHAEQARERGVLQAALATAQAAVRELNGRTAVRDAAINARSELLARLSEARDERYNRRRAIAAQLSADVPSLRVSIRQTANLDAYRAFVAEQLKGQRMKQGLAADRLVTALLPTELAALVFAEATEELAERAGIDAERARRIIDTLRESGSAYDLQTIDLGDVPCIELRDGETYKESSHLSTGQRCTVVLPILLRQSDRPLLIDQPEDNLDNAFVFDTVVGALKAVKLTRQVVFVTHNPNIPVLGDADRIFVFDSDGQQARVAEVGTVDECKEAVERILEGGASAFLERMKRYGH